MRLKMSHLCVVQMQFNRMASVCLPFFFLLFVLGWQSWPLISILPIMQMRTDHILVQMSKASAEARSPLGPSGNLHLKAILCDKTMAQVLCPWPRALSSPARQKVGVTPVSAAFCQLLARLIQAGWQLSADDAVKINERFHCFLTPPLHGLIANSLLVRSYCYTHIFAVLSVKNRADKYTHVKYSTFPLTAYWCQGGTVFD